MKFGFWSDDDGTERSAKICRQIETGSLANQDADMDSGEIWPGLSIVIPAKNEQENLLRLLPALKGLLREKVYEVVVVDNESTDRTIEVAETFHAKTIRCGGNVSRLRNQGAAISVFPVLLFLDADVLPADDWVKILPEVLGKLISTRKEVTGSWVSVPPDASWIENNWFKPLEVGSDTHINSAHLLVSKMDFEQLGGFDESLSSGEDFDFSERAKRMGYRINDDRRLVVYHYGFPKTLGEFFRREVWHGFGDAVLGRLIHSKVALASMSFFLALTIGLLSLLLFDERAVALVALGCALSMCVFSSAKKYAGAGASFVVTNAVLYAVYFLARSCSLVVVGLGLDLFVKDWLRSR